MAETWDEIGHCADEAHAALAESDHFRMIDSQHVEDRTDAVIDLMADLHHYCDRIGVDFEWAVQRGQWHYEEDRQEAQENADAELAESVEVAS